MKELDNLYQYTDSHGIAVFSYDFTRFKSISVADADGCCCIGLDPMQLHSHADELCTLAHEVGHCETGSFYNLDSRFDLKARHEYRADRWAAERLCPRQQVVDAISAGIEEIWQLAEHFSVTEEFISRALSLYHLL